MKNKLKTFGFTKIEKVKSTQIFQAETLEQAQKMLEVEGFDESCEEVISSKTESYEIKDKEGK